MIVLGPERVDVDAVLQRDPHVAACRCRYLRLSAKWPPVCSSWNCPTRKVGTRSRSIHAPGARCANSDGVRYGFARWSFSASWVCSRRRWLARQCLSPALHERLRPGLAAGGRGLRVVHALDHPGCGEARVEDAAGVAGGRVEVVGHRHRRDRRQVRRLRAGREELGDAGERDAAHADLAALDPALGGDRLDRVVAVVGRRVVEQVEGAARAARAAHLDADHGEAEQRPDQRADGGRRRRRERVVRRRERIELSRSCGAATW